MFGVEVGAQDKNLLGKMAHRAHVRHKIQPGTVIIDKNYEPLVIFGMLPKLDFPIWEMLEAIKIQKSRRLTRLNNGYSNLHAEEQTFGFRAMRPVFGNSAAQCEFNFKYPKYYEALLYQGLALMGEFRSLTPTRFEQQEAKLKSTVGPGWIMPGTIFTQGIINRSNQLAYHFDRGNFKEFWSCMAVYSKGVSGGELIIPSLDVALQTCDGCYVLFNGQNLIHGVSNIRKDEPDGKRYSIVYYSIEAMKNCGTQDEEVKKIRKTDMVKHRKVLGQ